MTNFMNQHPVVFWIILVTINFTYCQFAYSTFYRVKKIFWDNWMEISVCIIFSILWPLLVIAFLADKFIKWVLG